MSTQVDGRRAYRATLGRRLQAGGVRSFGIELERPLLVCAGIVVSVVLAYILNRKGVAYALIAIALPIGAWWVVRRPGSGLLAAIAALLVLPHWYAHIWLVVPSVGALGLIGGVARSRLRAVDCVMFLLVLWFVASWTLHQGLGVPVRWLIEGVVPFGVYLWTRLTLTEGLVVRVQWVALLAGTIGACTVLYEAAIGHAIFFDPLLYEWRGTPSAVFRAGGIFGGSPTAATVLATVFLVSMPLLRVRRNVVRALLLVILAAIIVTLDRAGLLGLILGAAVFALLLPYQRWGRVALVAFALGIGAYAVTTSSTLATLSTSRLVSAGIIRSDTFQARTTLASNAFQLLGSSPSSLIFGHGFDPFIGNGVFPKAIAEQTYLQKSGGPNNEYLRALLEQGIVGFVLELTWLLGALSLGVRTCRRLPPNSGYRRLVAALTGATACYIAAAAGHDMSHNPVALSIAALVTGLLVSACTLRSRTPCP